MPVQRVPHHWLDERTALLDNDDLLEAPGELSDKFTVEWKEHLERQDPHSSGREVALTDSELGERVHDVTVKMPCDNNSEPRPGRRSDLVQSVQARVFKRCRESDL